MEPRGEVVRKYWNYYGKVGNFDEGVGGGGGEASFFMSQELSVESRE